MGQTSDKGYCDVLIGAGDGGWDGDEMVLFTLYRWYFADNLYVPGFMIECRFTRALLGVHCTLAYIAGLCNICAWISRDCTLA